MGGVERPQIEPARAQAAAEKAQEAGQWTAAIGWALLAIAGELRLIRRALRKSDRR